MSDRLQRVARCAIAILGLSAPAIEASAQEMPRTQLEFYRAGERFAQCSAHFAFGAKIARDSGLPENANALEGMERGWRVAGLLLLTEGLDPSRQPQTQETFANFQAIKIDHFKAMRELDPLGYSKAMLDDYQRDCAPWAELQKSIIAGMRSGPQSR